MLDAPDDFLGLRKLLSGILSRAGGLRGQFIEPHTQGLGDTGFVAPVMKFQQRRQPRDVCGGDIPQRESGRERLASEFMYGLAKGHQLRR